MLKESQLHNYQRQSVTHVIDNPFSALLLDMGLGKTVSVIDTTEKLNNFINEIR